MLTMESGVNHLFWNKNKSTQVVLVILVQNKFINYGGKLFLSIFMFGAIK